MRLVAFLLFSTLLQLDAVAQTQGWTRIASSSSYVYSFKDDGYTIGDYRGDKAIAVTYKIYDVTKNSTEVGQLIVRLKDCSRGQGRLFFANLDGQTQSTGDFVFGVNTIATSLAENLCKPYLNKI